MTVFRIRFRKARRNGNQLRGPTRRGRTFVAHREAAVQVRKLADRRRRTTAYYGTDTASRPFLDAKDAWLHSQSTDVHRAVIRGSPTAQPAQSRPSVRRQQFYDDRRPGLYRGPGYRSGDSRHHCPAGIVAVLDGFLQALSSIALGNPHSTR